MTSERSKDWFLVALLALPPAIPPASESPQAKALAGS